MLKDFFGEWTNGRLDRKRYAILYTVWLGAVLLLGLSLMQGLLVPVEPGGSLRSAINNASPVVTGLLSIFSIALYLALLNICGKRARDTGLPGFVGILGMIALFVIAFLFLKYALGIVVTVAALLLALIPTGQFARRAA